MQSSYNTVNLLVVAVETRDQGVRHNFHHAISSSNHPETDIAMLFDGVFTDSLKKLGQPQPASNFVSDKTSPPSPTSTAI